MNNYLSEMQEEVEEEYEDLHLTTTAYTLSSHEDGVTDDFSLDHNDVIRDDMKGFFYFIRNNSLILKSLNSISFY